MKKFKAPVKWTIVLPFQNLIQSLWYCLFQPITIIYYWLILILYSTKTPYLTFYCCFHISIRKMTAYFHFAHALETFLIMSVFLNFVVHIISNSTCLSSVCVFLFFAQLNRIKQHKQLHGRYLISSDSIMW